MGFGGDSQGHRHRRAAPRPAANGDPLSRAVFADVAVRDSGSSTYTYSVPGDLRDDGDSSTSPSHIGPGCLVQVPLARRLLPGVVTRVHTETPLFPTRPLSLLIYPRPVLSDQQIELAQWVARTYRAGAWESLAPMLPPSLSRRLGALKESGHGRLRRWLDDLLDRPPDTVPLEPVSSPGLTSPQQRAFDSISTALRGGAAETFLLHGVTGSGKTLVYLAAAGQVMAGGRQVIVLVSEIALTPEAEQRFSARFPGAVVVLHSGLTDTQRDRAWARIRAGQAPLVVGSRSAVFAPTPRPGLIVVDEEHEWTYKQDQSPRYHARAVAVARARLAGACVVLSSATPDVSTYHRALRGRLQLLELPERYRPVRSGQWPVASDQQPSHDQRLTTDHRPLATSRPSDLPMVEVVDLRRELREGNRSIFSRALRAALLRTHERGEQAILFLNRRGAATCVTCRACGHTLHCRRCQIPLTYHQGSRGPDARTATAQQLICHRCNRRSPVPPRCPECGGLQIRFLGLGTQRVEQEVRSLLPDARVRRWDRDAISPRGDYERLWGELAGREVDVLIGTQMVAKALDVPTVTLVGAVLADSGLYLPDFRAAERTFQLLTQVAGRAGRAALEGRAIVQTYAPDHYAVAAAARHDFLDFYQKEIDFRRQFGYPPFRRIARLVFSASNEQRCWRETHRVRRSIAELHQRLDLVDLELVGPTPCFQLRLRGRYRWQLLLLGDRFDRILDNLSLGHGWTVDVDPASVL